MPSRKPKPAATTPIEQLLPEPLPADEATKGAGNPAWKKGVSGNPNGRPRKVPKIQPPAVLVTAPSSAPMVVIPHTPQFIAVGKGGFALNHIVSWEPLPNGELEVVLAATDWNRQLGYPEQRTMVLTGADVGRFLSAIHTVAGLPDPATDRLQQERDSAIALGVEAEKERDEWKRKHQELEQQGTQARANITRLRQERDDALNKLEQYERLFAQIKGLQP